MAKTTRFALPLLSSGQAQKEATHNEALLILDAALHGCCALGPSNTPPTEPELGLSYLCGTAPAGAWVGHAKAVASWSESGWRFSGPVEGQRLHDRGSGRTWCYAAGQWQLGIVHAAEVRANGTKVLGVQQPAVANPSGGSVVDNEARNALAQILAALRSHGLIATPG